MKRRHTEYRTSPQHEDESQDPITIVEALAWLTSHREIYIPKFEDEFGYQLFEPDYHPESFDVLEHYREFQLVGRPTREELRSLLDLPFEVAITEAQGTLFLSTGLPGQVPQEGGFARRIKGGSRLFFHTHPIEGRINDVPSLGDVLFMALVSPTSRSLLATPHGMVEFQRPRIHPVTGKSIDYGTTEEKYVLLDFAVANRFTTGAFFADLFGGERTNWLDLPFETQTELTIAFVRKSGMIVQEAGWDDLDKVNAIIELFKV